MADGRYGPLRVVCPLRAMADAPDGADDAKDFFKRLALMAPAEVTGFYLTFRPVLVGKLSEAEVTHDPLCLAWPWICLALAVFVRAWATRRTASLWSFQRVPVVVAALAFLFWVLAMGHPVAWVSALMWDPRVATIGAAVFTFVVPYVYKGDPPPAPEPIDRTPVPVGG